MLRYRKACLAETAERADASALLVVEHNFLLVMLVPGERKVEEETFRRIRLTGFGPSDLIEVNYSVKLFKCLILSLLPCLMPMTRYGSSKGL